MLGTHQYDHTPRHFGRAFAIGVTLNLAGSEGDLNIRGAFLHMSADALNERFGIHHTVLQQESEGYAANCPTACGS